MLAIDSIVGKSVKFLYPKNGSRNILRNVVGTVVLYGTGPNGPYIKVDEIHQTHSFSLSKIVNFKTV